MVGFAAAVYHMRHVVRFQLWFSGRACRRCAVYIMAVSRNGAVVFPFGCLYKHGQLHSGKILFGEKGSVQYRAAAGYQGNFPAVCAYIFHIRAGFYVLFVWHVSIAYVRPAFVLSAGGGVFSGIAVVYYGICSGIFQGFWPADWHCGAVPFLGDAYLLEFNADSGGIQVDI